MVNSSQEFEPMLVEPVRTEPSVAHEFVQVKNGLPYSFAKKHSVLLEMDDSDHATLLHTGTIKLKVLAEIKRRFDQKLTLTALSTADFEERLRKFYDRGGNQANQLMDDMDDGLDLERQIGRAHV